MTELKYKLATGFPVISLTYSEYVHLQFARQRQPGDWIEWPSMERDTRQILSHLLDVGKVPFIEQRNDAGIRIIVKEPGNAFPGAGARRPDRLNDRELHLVRGLCRSSRCCARGGVTHASHYSRSSFIHNLLSLGLTPVGLHFLLQQLLWTPPPVASFNEAAIGLLRGSVEIPVK